MWGYVGVRTSRCAQKWYNFVPRNTSLLQHPYMACKMNGEKPESVEVVEQEDTTSPRNTSAVLRRPEQHQEQTRCPSPTRSTSSPVQSRNVAVVSPRLASQSWRVCTIQRRINSLPYARAPEQENNNLEDMRIVEIRGGMISQVGERLVNLGHFCFLLSPTWPISLTSHVQEATAS